MAWHLREETSEDRPGIYRVHREAFGGEVEPRIVEGLRDTPYWVPGLSLVAEDAGEIIGHVLLSRVELRDSPRPVSLLALGPVGVLPERQNSGVGTALIERVLLRAEGSEFDGVVVLGHAGYYPRFGFVPASRFGIRCPFGVPDENYLARELRPGGLAGAGGTVLYPAPWLQDGPSTGCEAIHTP